ncbi:MAG TPA: tetratricopeptide repeat protein, partial [Blastocatellia bacterium]|nr:tetratricopeptide repeat protein [Blastocatellia bacterium]
MFSKFVRAALPGALTLWLAAAAFAQSGPIEGTVKIKQADGTMTPVAGALVEIYRTDIKGKWDVKTDKNGRYVRLGMPIAGTFLVVASGPGMQPTYLSGIRLVQSSVVDIVANPGDGSTFSPEQIQELLKGGSAPAATAPRQMSAQDKAKMEAQQKEQEAKVKEAQEMQSAFETARTRYNQGIEMMKTNNYQAAVSEFEAASQVDPSKHAAFAELAYRANANAAEAHYQIGVDLFNKKQRNEAKPHFEQAVKMAAKAIEVASTQTGPTINNDLIVYYNIWAKNAKLLVEFYGAADLVDPAIKNLDKAAELDAANKSKWGVMKGDILRGAGRTDEAVAAYQAVITADPNNIDALYGLGLTLVASTDKDTIQKGA